MVVALLASLSILSAAFFQGAPVQEPIAALVQQLQSATAAGNREAIRALGTEPETTADFALALTSPPPSRVQIRERDRTPVAGGQRLLLEVFWERAGEGRLSTWTVDVTHGEEGWRIASAARLAHVTGLYRLSLNRAKQFDVRDLVVRAPDLALTLQAGSAFVAETPEGVTAVVLIGRGTMRFAPPDLAERIQVRIFSGSDVLQTSFDAAFIRVRPEDFDDSFARESMVERAPSPRDLNRAQRIFDEYIGRTFQIDLSDLSPDRWSITPQPGNFIAEIDTADHDTLTYTRSRGDAEDVTLFDRKKRKNIAVYASADTLASRGRSYNEDDLVDYDILAYDLEASIVPERQTISGNARLKLKVRAPSAATINLRLAEELTVNRVYSPAHGRLLHLRVVNQNSLIVSLPEIMPRGSEILLEIQYAGRIPPQELEREAITVSQDFADPLVIPPEPRFIYSNRSYWYPQSIVSDYAPAKMRITVPAVYDVIATGIPVGEPSPPPGLAENERQRVFVFESVRPVRYLACVISRLRHVEDRHVKLGDGEAEELELHVRSNSRQVSRARALADAATAVLSFYGTLIGDSPYPAFTLGVTENDTPGGHSPAYFAVVDQPQQTGLSWRNDPVNFDNYPSFFVAHEIAHQWWGQAIGWKNYHEQWLSEGFAQYFAVLYAEERLPPGVATNVFRQMRQTAMNQSWQGPISLGYRLGHIKGDSRAFRSILYNKSAMVLHMLRRLIGHAAFLEGVREFYGEWKYRKAGTDDLRAAMQKASGRDLSGFFDAWIFGATIPRASFTYKVNGSTAVLRLEQHTAPMEFPLTVRLTYRSGRAQTVLMIPREKVTEYSVELPERLKSVTPNADYGTIVNIR